MLIGHYLQRFCEKFGFWNGDGEVLSKVWFGYVGEGPRTEGVGDIGDGGEESCLYTPEQFTGLVTT